MMSKYSVTLTVLATGLAEAVAKDERSDDGFDLSASVHVSEWLAMANAAEAKIEAAAKDERPDDDDDDGFDLSAGLYGVHVLEWLREVAEAITDEKRPGAKT